MLHVSVFLIRCKQLLLLEVGSSVASQLMHQPYSDLMFSKPFCLGFILCGAFYAHAHGYELLCFFNNIFKLESTMYKWRTLRTAH